MRSLPPAEPDGLTERAPGHCSRRKDGHAHAETFGQLPEHLGAVDRMHDPRCAPTWFPGLVEGLGQDGRLAQAGSRPNDGEASAAFDGVDEPGQGLLVTARPDERPIRTVKGVRREPPVAFPPRSGSWTSG